MRFSGIFNFRDLGGHLTADGRRVAPGRLFRSDGLFRLDADERVRLGALGIRTVLDLRRPDEIVVDGRFPETAGVQYHHVNLDVAPWQHAEEPVDVAGYLAGQYVNMAEAGLVGSAAAQGPIGRCLRLLAEAEAAPLVFHCAIGKDRTGVLAALTLSLLGVADDVIAEDYGRSSEGLRRFYRYLRDRKGDTRPLSAWEKEPAPPEAILLFLMELRVRHGSVEEYAARAGVDNSHVEALRSGLLEG